MNTKALPVDIREFLNKHVTEVFETMLSQTARPAEGAAPHFTERVTGSIGFGGERINGALYLHLSAAFSRQIAVSMLGLPPEETPGETDINDVIGEMTNMLAGGLKSSFCDAGAACAVSTPAIIRGSSFQIETVPDVTQEIMVFESGADRFAVEVHVRFD